MTTLIVPRRKVTPTGVLVLPADAPREQWLAERKNGITATDLPAIMGNNKYKTAIDVWNDKLTPLENDGNFEPGLGHMEAAFWGITLEDSIAKAWAEQTGVTVRRIGIIAHQSADWMRASLDRMVTNCPDGKCGLEVKTRSAYVLDEWQQGVPQDVLDQVNWQLLVSGLDHIHVIALCGQKLAQHVVRLNPSDKSYLTEAAWHIWESVTAGIAPTMPQALWTEDYLNAKYQNRDGVTEVAPQVDEIVTEYQVVGERIKSLKAEQDKLKLLLIGSLGEHEIATLEERPLFSYKPTTKRILDADKLAEYYPDTVTDERIYKTTTSRTLRISTTKKGK